MSLAENEASLQSAQRCNFENFRLDSKSVSYRRNSSEPRQDPCAIPNVTGTELKLQPYIEQSI